jgi:hypothetical protein
LFPDIQNYQITQLPNFKSIGFIHGEYEKVKQGRTQESPARIAQKAEGGKAGEAEGIRPWFAEAQSKEAGARPGETVGEALSSWQSTLDPRSSHWGSRVFR